MVNPTNAKISTIPYAQSRVVRRCANARLDLSMKMVDLVLWIVKLKVPLILIHSVSVVTLTNSLHTPELCCGLTASAFCGCVRADIESCGCGRADIKSCSQADFEFSASCVSRIRCVSRIICAIFTFTYESHFFKPMSMERGSFSLLSNRH